MRWSGAWALPAPRPRSNGNNRFVAVALRLVPLLDNADDVLKTLTAMAKTLPGVDNTHSAASVKHL